MALSWPIEKEGQRSPGTLTVEPIRTVQYLLRQHGSANVVADGIFGPKTAAGVRDFQSAHGLLVDGTLWRNVIPRLEGDFRCIAPDWPVGSHLIPATRDAALSSRGIAHLVAEFLERLDLEDVTLVANDSGGVVAQLLAVERPERVGRLVLTPCDAFDNFFPPQFRSLWYLARIPGSLALGLQVVRIARVGRLKLAFGGVTKYPVPADVVETWLRPSRTSRAIRRDTKRFMRAIDNRDTLYAAERLSSFTRPVLLAWATEDRVFPFEHARRLAEIFPDATLAEVHDSYSFVPEDQPARLAQLVADFAGTRPAKGKTGTARALANSPAS